MGGYGFRQADQPCHHRQCPLRRVAKAQADAPVQHFLCSQHDRSGGTLEHLPVAWLQVKGSADQSSSWTLLPWTATAVPGAGAAISAARSAVKAKL